MTLNNTTVEDNSSPLGAGIANDGDLTLNGGTVSSNTSTGRGGGIENLGTLTADGTTIIGNTATSNGGGIFNADGATLTVTNGTISNNTATIVGGGIFSSEQATLTLNDTLIQENAAANGGGVANDGRFELGGEEPPLKTHSTCGAMPYSEAALPYTSAIPYQTTRAIFFLSSEISA